MPRELHHMLGIRSYYQSSLHTNENSWPRLQENAPKEKTNWRLLLKERLYERCEIFQGSNLGMLKNMLSESLTNMNGSSPYDNNSKKEKKRPGRTPFQSKQAPR